MRVRLRRRVATDVRHFPSPSTHAPVFIAIWRARTRAEGSVSVSVFSHQFLFEDVPAFLIGRRRGIGLEQSHQVFERSGGGSSEMGRASKDSRIRRARVIPCAGGQVLTRSRTSLIGSLSTTLMVQSPSAASKRAFSSMLTPPLAFTISLPKGSRTRRSLGWVVPHSKTT